MRSIAALLFFAATASATLIGFNSLTELGQSASFVVVGNFDGIRDGIRQDGAALTVQLKVDRVLKGDASLAGGLITVVWTAPGVNPRGMGAPAPRLAANGLWFLKQDGAGWQVLPVMQNVSFERTFLAAPAGPIAAPYAYSDTATLNDKIASEVCALLASGQGDSSTASFLYHGLLDQLQSPVLPVFYHRMADSALPRERLIGLAGLIREGSADALTAAALTPHAWFDSYALEAGVLVSSLRDNYRPADAKEIAILGEIATGVRGPDLLSAAGFALRAIHTLGTLPYLARMMESTEASIRAEGVGGMAAFANGLTVQTPAGVPSLAYLQMPKAGPYKTADTMANFAMGDAVTRNEAKYLTFWKSWWSEHRGELGY